MESVGFAVPDLARPSGGNTYNTQVIRAWPADAPPLVPTVLPYPADDLDAQLEQVLHRHEVTVVDGLIGSEHPLAIERASAVGHRVVLLVHMPRPADTGLDDAQRVRLAQLEPRAIVASWRVVVPSHWAAQDLESRYGRGNFIVATPGTELAAIATVHTPPTMVQLAAISPLKNQLLTVAAAIACQDMDFRLRLIGPVVDSDYATEVLRALAPLGERATMEPEVLHAAVDTVFADCDLIISVATRETYGLTITEGLARGIPAIVGADTGATEALAAGQVGQAEKASQAGQIKQAGQAGPVSHSGPATLSGVAVRTDDPADLTAALRAFLTQPDLRATWRTTALTARDHLPGWETTANTIAEACMRTAPETVVISN